MQPLISISIVTWNSMPHIQKCLQHIHEQKGIRYEIIISDNGSSDGTLEFLRTQSWVKIIENGFNSGFSFAHNQAIKNSSGDFVLILNPDVFLSPTYTAELLFTIQLGVRIGQATGKLYRVSSVTEIGNSIIIDSTGLYFTRNQRHFDRGSNEVDLGQYDNKEYIFGVCGAAALYRREALDDSAINYEYFDEDFFAYREDADLSWRMQLLGWKAAYSPSAVAYHIRGMRSNDDRKSVPPIINMHSVKNRFLMRIKNQTISIFIRNASALIWRDIQVIGYVVLIEHTSLPAFIRLIRLLPKTLRKRRFIMNNKQVDDEYIARWFVDRPVSFPLG